MRLLVFVAAFASASVLKAGDAAPPTWTGIARKIETAVPELIEKHKTPGVSVTLVDDRKIVWAKGFGVRNAQTADPVDTDTIFEACSMSKPLFAYAVLIPRASRTGGRAAGDPTTRSSSNSNPELASAIPEKAFCFSNGSSSTS